MNRYLGIAASAAVLAICSAQAQVTCAIQNTTPATIRQEGIAELLSDIVLQCTGGTPTASGQPVPVVDVTLTFVYGFTNRLLGKNYTDALLTLDEPYPSTPVPAAGIPANQPVQRLCYSTAAASPGSCNYLLGTGGGGYQTASDPYLQSNASTIYASAQLASYDEITWYGVPLDPPGPNGAVRYIRLTNLRTNARAIPTSTQLIASVTISGTRFSIGNPQTSLGTIEPGLIAADTSLPLCGCASHNASLVGGSGTPAFDATVQATEGSAGAFKRRNIGLTTDGTTPPAVYPQNIPGYPYNTETGFLPSPSIVSPPAYTLQPADSGTRLILVFSNVIQGMHIFSPSACR